MSNEDKILRNELGKLDVGDTLFNVALGEVVITSIDMSKSIKFPNYAYSSSGNCGLSINEFGFVSTKSNYPAVFKSIEHAIKFFETVKAIDDRNNNWTIGKILKCPLIKFGAQVNSKKKEHPLRIVLEKGKHCLIVIEEGNVTPFELFFGASASEYEFLDMNGKVINPKEYN